MEEITLLLTTTSYEIDGSEIKKVEKRKELAKRDYLNAERKNTIFGTIKGNDVVFYLSVQFIEDFDRVEVIDSKNNKYLVTETRYLKSNLLIYCTFSGKVNLYE